MVLRKVSAILLIALFSFAQGKNVVNVALGKSALSSGNENNDLVAAKAFDGNFNRAEKSRWSSNLMSNSDVKNGVWTAPSADKAVWLQVDLGEVKSGLKDFCIDWEFPKVTNCAIMTSTDGVKWSTVWERKEKNSNLTEVVSLKKAVNARYVKLVINGFMVEGWNGISIYDFQIFNGEMPISFAMKAKTFDVAKSVDVTGKKIKFNLPRGTNARIFSSNVKQILDVDGKINRPISDIVTDVVFELSNGKEVALTPIFPIVIKGKGKVKNGANAKPAVVPALQEWEGDFGEFKLSEKTRIVVKSEDANKGKPTLLERMQIFGKDYTEITGLPIEVVVAKKSRKGDIVIELDDDNKLGKEGYEIDIENDKIEIDALDPVGAFWATRTLLQVFKNNNNAFPCGDIRDYPIYPIRGFMFDVGRKPVSLEAIYNVMKTMSWYKMNDLQLHLNDNYIWLSRYTQIPNGKDATPEQKKAACDEVLNANPSGFRLESDIVGKNGKRLTSTDMSYSKKDFGKLIDDSKLIGINIVPEIDVPGHALSLISVRPDLMYRGTVYKAHDVERVALLDNSLEKHPETGKTYREETMDFVKTIFGEYMKSKDGKPAVFRDSVVHIGSDEYYGDSEGFRAFIDELLKWVKKEGFTPRYWGNLTAKQGKTPVIADGVQMQIWSLGWQNPIDAINLGYDIINIQDVIGYIVPNGNGNVGGYGDYINLPHIYSQNWAPHVMGNKSVQPGHKQLKGAMWALWNDNTFITDTGLTDFDLYDRIRKSCSVYAEKTWNNGRDRNYDDFVILVDKINLPPRNTIPKKITAAVSLNQTYVLNEKTPFIKTGKTEVAPDYTATFFVKRADAKNDEQILFTSPYGTFKAVQKDSGKVGITNDTWDFSFDYTLPVNKWVKLTLVANGRNLKLFADDKEIGVPKRHKFPENHKFATFVFPINMIGAEKNGFKGEVKDITIQPN